MKKVSLEQRLSHISIIGAAGKMGRGISLVMLKLIIDHNLRKNEKSTIVLVDNQLESLQGLKSYLETQMLKHAERNIISLREIYKNNQELIDNSQIIEKFLSDCWERIFLTTDITECQHSHMIFEAIFEDIHLKNDLYQRLNSLCSEQCLFLSNTSSIPISEINSNCHLDNRIIGFHFYNPPAVQKLVEVISMKDTPILLLDMANELILALNKIAVPSQDIAGFIGNGHFIREGLYAFKILGQNKQAQPKALYYINQLYTDLLLRPMGIFQLIDYVGLDVFKMICTTMGTYLDEDFSCPTIDLLLQNDRRGGQFSDGTQKNGFFKYEKGQIKAIYDIEQNQYIPCSEVSSSNESPENKSDKLTWKALSRDPHKNEKINEHFTALAKDQRQESLDARQILNESIQIATKLVTDGVTTSIDHVDTVLMNGFFHLYGPGSAVLTSLKELEQ